MHRRKRTRRGISLGTFVMLACTFAVLGGFAALMPSFTGNQDILIDAARLAVAIDDSLMQLSASTGEMLQSYVQPQQTIIPPFESHTLLYTAGQNESNTLPSTTNVPEPVPTISPRRAFTFCAAGTIEVNSSVRKALTLDNEVRFDLLTDQLQNQLQADLSIASLKNTISVSNDLSNVNTSSDLLVPIKSTGINVLSVGHANTLNFGLKGLNETTAAASAAGITAVEASNPAFLSFNEVSVALLHYQDQFSNTSRKLLTEEERYSLLSPIDLSLIASDIAAARQNGAQVVVVTLCWGEQGKHEPTAEQVAEAQAIADAGADIIIGSGNGALQPVRVLSANRGDSKYHPVLCAYSLGNLFSPDRDSRVTLASILLKTKVIYDTASQTVAFENLSYTPAYAWRGKDNGRTLQRILINNPAQLPDFVDEAQQGVMQRCMVLVTDVMDDTAIPLMY